MRRASALRVGLPFESFIGPLTPLIRAQNDLLRGPPFGCGAFRLDPVALLYLSRPAFVRPPDRDLCTPIFRLTDFLVATFATFLATARSFTFMRHYFLPLRSFLRSFASILFGLPAIRAIVFCLGLSGFFFFAGGRPTFDPYVPGP